MSKQWIRKYRIRISLPDSSAYKGSTTSSLYFEIDDLNLEVAFNCKKTMLREPNRCEVTIYNLSSVTESALIQEGSKITIEAGYVDNFGVIFKGQILQFIRGKENGVDYYIKLICLDSDAFLNLAFANGIIAPNITRRQLVEQTLRQSNVPLDSINTNNLQEANVVDGSEVKIERHKVIFGSPSRAIERLAKFTNSSFYIEDGEGKFFNALQSPIPGQAHLINRETGMIGTPHQQGYGIVVTVLLNPGIKLNDFIKIDNSLVVVNETGFNETPHLLDSEGLYRVIGIQYDGRVRGNNWFAKLTAITQNGPIPAVLTTGSGEIIV